MRCRSTVAGSSVLCCWCARSVFATRIPLNPASCFVIGRFLRVRRHFLRTASEYKILSNHNSEHLILQANHYTGGGIFGMQLGTSNLGWAEDTRVFHDLHYYILDSLNLYIYIYLLKCTMAGSRLEKVGTVFTRYVFGSKVMLVQRCMLIHRDHNLVMVWVSSYK